MYLFDEDYYNCFKTGIEKHLKECIGCYDLYDEILNFYERLNDELIVLSSVYTAFYEYLSRLKNEPILEKNEKQDKSKIR
jgi:hypothetical protein